MHSQMSPTPQMIWTIKKTCAAGIPWALCLIDVPTELAQLVNKTLSAIHYLWALPIKLLTLVLYIINIILYVLYVIKWSSTTVWYRTGVFLRGLLPFLRRKWVVNVLWLFHWIESFNGWQSWALEQVFQLYLSFLILQWPCSKVITRYYWNDKLKLLKYCIWDE